MMRPDPDRAASKAELSMRKVTTSPTASSAGSCGPIVGNAKDGAAEEAVQIVECRMVLEGLCAASAADDVAGYAEVNQRLHALVLALRAGGEEQGDREDG